MKPYDTVQQARDLSTYQYGGAQQNLVRGLSCERVVLAGGAGVHLLACVRDRDCDPARTGHRPNGNRA